MAQLLWLLKPLTTAAIAVLLSARITRRGYPWLRAAHVTSATVASSFQRKRSPTTTAVIVLNAQPAKHQQLMEGQRALAALERTLQQMANSALHALLVK